MDTRAAQADFAPPTQRPAEGCGDDRPGTVAEGQVGALKLAYDLVELVPVSVLRLEQDQHEVCAGGKIAGLIADDQTVKVALQFFQAAGDHADGIFPNGVELGMKLQAGDPITQINQAGPRVCGGDAVRRFDRGQHQNPNRFFHRAIPRGGQIEILTPALGRAIECLLAAFQHGPHDRRYGAVLGVQPFRDFFDAHHIPRLKRAKIPGIAPAHRAVDVHDVVGNLGDPPRRVAQDAAEQPPDELARRAAIDGQRPQTPGGILNQFRRLQHRQRDLAPRAVLHGRVIQGVDLPVDALVETGAGLVAEPAPPGHLPEQRRHDEHVALLVVCQVTVRVF